MAVIAATLIVGCSSVIDELPTYDASSRVKVGDIAPDFEATTIDNKPVVLSSHKGESVVLIFVSVTCPDCKALLDELNPRLSELEGKAKVYAIARSATREQAAEYIEQGGYDIEMIADPEKQIYSKYATAYVPRSYIVGAEGRVELMVVEYTKGDAERIINFFF